MSNEMNLPWLVVCRPDHDLQTDFYGILVDKQMITIGMGAWAKDIAERTVQAVNAHDGLVEALQKLACLGNGDRYGNSDGNCIAQAALAKAQGDGK